MKLSEGVMLGPHYAPDVRLFYFAYERLAVGVKRTGRTRPILFIITKGAGCFFRDNKEYPLKKGDLFLLFPGKGLSWRPNAAVGWDYVALELIGRDVPLLLQRMGFSPECPTLRPEQRDKVVRCTLEYTGELYKNRWDPFSLQSDFLRFIHQILLLTEPTPQIAYITRAKKYIQTSYRDPITVAGIAEMLCLSERQFSACFKREIGITAQEYLIRCRVDAAARMLRESDRSLSEICELSGFRSKSAFYTAFRQRKGATPAQYRAEI